MDPLRIAVFAAKFDPTFKNPWLTDELCEALDTQGHTVDVFFLDWYREFTAGVVTAHGNTRVHIIAPVGSKSSLISKMLHWTFSSLNVYRCYRSHFKDGNHDALISFSPSIMFGIALLRLKSAFKHRILIQWDFFPYHQEQIGLIPFRWMTRAGAILESKLLSTFTFIGCMSPRNLQYLTTRYRLASHVRTGVVPLWTRLRDKPNVNKDQIRRQFSLPLSTPIAVFGGQIALGRGVEDVVAAATLAAKSNAPVHFLFVGKGPRLKWLKEQAIRINAGFTVLPHVPRDKYLELISSCDVGIVATVRDVDVPTFPSKTIDYCCAGLPIVASVEHSTDYGEIVAAAGIGLACEAGDSAKLLELCLSVLADDKAKEKFSRQSRRFYEENFDVQKVALELVSRVGAGQRMSPRDQYETIG
jgi:glycosyltransferase involved in cell wall biosynthesis